jgi:predicted MarR family transcription regulator
MKKLEFYLWTRILLYIYNNNDKTFISTDVCKALNISTTGSVSANTKLLEKYGLITVRREGRHNEYTLTTEGHNIAIHLEKIFDEIKFAKK